ncbi:MAG: CocE/NonD family hydrolase, partial [Bacteroidales bacterium]
MTRRAIHQSSLRLCAALFLSLLACTRANPTQPPGVETEYRKSEHQVAMRDGVKLHTIVYTPRDTSRSYPILLWRTPYSIGPYGPGMRSPLTTNPWLLEEKYIFVFQDVRGKYMSEGNFVDMRPVLDAHNEETDTDETTDTWDTAEWLIRNLENNNGKIGLYGISYPGFYAALAGINAHPSVVCISPQAPISDWFLWDDMHHNGALTLPLVYNFFRSFGVDRPVPSPDRQPGLGRPEGDAYHFFLELGPLRNVNEQLLHGEIDFWNQVTEHPDYDKFWQSRSTLSHFRDVTPAVLTVGGWFDGEDLSGALHTYAAIEDQSRDTENTLV